MSKQKIEYIVFTTRRLKNSVLNVDKKVESNSVKYLGVIIDTKLKLDEEVKKILQRMASGIKFVKVYQKKRKSY